MKIKNKIILLILVFLLLQVIACQKDNHTCIEDRCYIEHTGTILFLPPYEGLYFIGLQDDSNNLVTSKNINTSITSSLMDSVFSYNVSDTSCYKLSILYWIATGGTPDSIFEKSNVCVTECDTTKIYLN